MPLMDEFREEREALKHKPLRERLSYFFYYYKWHLAAVAAGAFLILSLAGQLAGRKDTALYAVLVNGTELAPGAQYSQGFADYLGLDLQESQVIFDASLRINPGGHDQITVASGKKLMVYVASNEADIFISDPATMELYAVNGIFYDLRDFLTEEQTAAYSPCFYYVDQGVMDAMKDNLDYSYTPGGQDPRDPLTMEDPVPVGIFLDNAAALKESYSFSGGQAVIAVVANTQRPEAARSCLDYILQQNLTAAP